MPAHNRIWTYCGQDGEFRVLIRHEHSRDGDRPAEAEVGEEVVLKLAQQGLEGVVHAEVQTAVDYNGGKGRRCEGLGVGGDYFYCWCGVVSPLDE